MEPSETDQPASRGETAADPAIDRVMFTVVIAVVAAACVPLGLMPERAAAFVSDLYDRLTHNFGFLYQWCAIGTMLFLTWLAAGRFGDVRLGGDGERPDFSTFSWAGMLFCAGSGASLLVWGGVEWITYYNAPPYGAEPRSVEAIEWATAYGPFHWGVTAWSLYALATIAIAYPFYVQRVPHLCTSTSWHALLGPQGHRSIVGRLVNLAAMLGLLGGAGTSLGLIAPMIAAVTAELFGIESSLTLEMGIVVFCVGLFGLSVYLGLERGIKRLSDLNVVLVLAFLAYIVLVGPTLFILKTSTDTVGFMVQNFVRMMTWTDAVESTGFVEAWTIFYWAWWIAFAPVVGIFVTRISRGRTIRQVILSMVFFGTLGCWIVYFVMGNYALYLELENMLPLSAILAESGMNVVTARIVASLPHGAIALAVLAVVGSVSVATTYDSASYTLAATVTAELGANQNPTRGHRLFWALVIGVLPIFMMLVGGLQVIRLGVLIGSFPVLFIGIGMAISLVKSLNQSVADEE